MQLFRKPLFGHPDNLQKYSHLLNLKYQKRQKMGTNGTKILDQFLTRHLDQLLTQKPPKIGPIVDSTACIAGKSNNGTYFGGFEVKQPDAPPLHASLCTTKIGLFQGFFGDSI